MPDPTEGERAEADAPFIVEHRQEDAKPGGTFRPAARLVLAPALRTGGLWHALPPEDTKNLLLLLTFLTPNGWCRPTLPELAAAMQASPVKARARMMRLAGTDWHGQPLVTVLTRPDGLDAFLPGRHLLAHEEQVPPEAARPAPARAAGREAVVNHSRAAYARTRQEVERDIAERMGWAPPAFDGEDPANAEAKRRAYRELQEIGLARDEALDLLARFDTERVARQVGWLPLRGAKNPARFLIAAVEGDYEAPPALRRQAGPAPEPTGEAEAGAANRETV